MQLIRNEQVACSSHVTSSKSGEINSPKRIKNREYIRNNKELCLHRFCIILYSLFFFIYSLRISSGIDVYIKNNFKFQILQKTDQKLHITQFLIFPCYSIINRRGYEYLNVNYINPFGERR